MKKITTYLIATLALIGAIFATAGCTRDYDDPAEPKWVILTPTMTIAELKAGYQGMPTIIATDEIIVGKIVSSDEQTNIYRSLYIQDESGGIEFKIGKTNTYSFYSPGRILSIRLKDLAIGAYGGMVQLGAVDPTGEYETSYIDVQTMIDLKTELSEEATPADLPVPIEVTSYSQLTPALEGCLIRIRGARYVGLDYAQFYDSQNNRIQVDTITTWAIPGYSDNPGLPIPKAYASHAFTLDGQEFVVRTSGYSKFGYMHVEERAPKGQPVDITAIYTTYNGTKQLLLNRVEDVVRQ